MKQPQFGGNQLVNRFNNQNSLQNSMQVNRVNNPAFNQPSLFVNQNAINQNQQNILNTSGLKMSINSASSGYNSRPTSNLAGSAPQPLPSIGQPNRSQAWMDWNKNVASANM